MPKSSGQNIDHLQRQEGLGGEEEYVVVVRSHFKCVDNLSAGRTFCKCGTSFVLSWHALLDRVLRFSETYCNTDHLAKFPSRVADLDRICLQFNAAKT